MPGQRRQDKVDDQEKPGQEKQDEARVEECCLEKGQIADPGNDGSELRTREPCIEEKMSQENMRQEQEQNPDPDRSGSNNPNIGVKEPCIGEEMPPEEQRLEQVQIADPDRPGIEETENTSENKQDTAVVEGERMTHDMELEKQNGKNCNNYFMLTPPND